MRPVAAVASAVAPPVDSDRSATAPIPPTEDAQETSMAAAPPAVVVAAIAAASTRVGGEGDRASIVPERVPVSATPAIDDAPLPKPKPELALADPDAKVTDNAAPRQETVARAHIKAKHHASRKGSPPNPGPGIPRCRGAVHCRRQPRSRPIKGRPTPSRCSTARPALGRTGAAQCHDRRQWLDQNGTTPAAAPQQASGAAATPARRPAPPARP